MNGRKILVVDDERMTRRMLEAILTGAGYIVVTAEDGKAAVELAESERPDLVLIDGLLPKLHGFVACKTIKQFECAPKVVILTGVYTKPTYRWEAKKEYGADDVLKKPVKPEELLACIEKQLESARTEIDVPQEIVIAAQSETQTSFALVD